MNAASAAEIIFTRNGTEAINLVAYCYGRDISEGRRRGPALRRWNTTPTSCPGRCCAKRTGVKLRSSRSRTTASSTWTPIERRSRAATKLVAITQMSNALGTVTPVKEIIRLAHEAGAKVLVDGCQMVPHEQLDVQALDADFYVFSGHKLYGPTGIGVLYGKARTARRHAALSGRRRHDPHASPSPSPPSPRCRRASRRARRISPARSGSARRSIMSRVRHGRIARPRTHAAGLCPRAPVGDQPGAHLREAPQRGSLVSFALRGRASPRHRHHPRPRGHRGPRRPPLRPAGDGAFRHLRARCARRFGLYNTTEPMSTRWSPAFDKVKEIFG